MKFEKMDFSIKTADKKNSLNTIRTDCIVIGIYDDHKLTDAATALDSGGAVTRALESGDISGKAGSALLISFPEKVAAKRLLVLGLGKKPTAEKDFRQAIDAAIKTVKPLNVGEIQYPAVMSLGRFTVPLPNCTPCFITATP